jgi:hypothetical protein
MRVLAVATILLLSSSLVPTLAQEEGKAPAQSQPETAPAPTQPQTVPVQPERTHSNRSKLVSKVRIGRRTSKSVAIGERNRAMATRLVAWARMAWGE